MAEADAVALRSAAAFCDAGEEQVRERERDRGGREGGGILHQGVKSGRPEAAAVALHSLRWSCRVQKRCR